MTDKFVPLPHKSFRRVRAAMALLLMIVMVSCGGDAQDSAADNKAAGDAEGFTFFDLGAGSVYSEATRRSLEKKLGNDATSHRNMIKLQVNYSGFLKQHFPVLDELNRQLNSSIGERVDHDTVKLMYRYARKQDVPFDYVEILFSDHSKHPLLIDMQFGKDTLGTVDRLKEKYGPPEKIEWESGSGTTLFWEKDQDYLMVSMAPDQFGDIEHRITIYFTENLRELIRAEHAKRQQSGDEPSTSVKSPF